MNEKNNEFIISRQFGVSRDLMFKGRAVDKRVTLARQRDSTRRTRAGERGIE